MTFWDWANENPGWLAFYLIIFAVMILGLGTRMSWMIQDSKNAKKELEQERRKRIGLD